MEIYIIHKRKHGEPLSATNVRKNRIHGIIPVCENNLMYRTRGRYRKKIETALVVGCITSQTSVRHIFFNQAHVWIRDTFTDLHNERVGVKVDCISLLQDGKIVFVVSLVI